MNDFECKKCNGSGYVTCDVCNGEKRTGVCSRCDGNGMIQNETGENLIKCPYCEGTGKPICTNCLGSGEILCPACGGSGEIE